ncbi:MAG: hypothetical protein OJJ54_16910 [Pseudonocardia sp.]|nr:hypothetical protein [Pseudonocardia sp.]
MIVAVVVVLVAIAVAARLMGGKRRSAQLRERFGPEYERHLAQSGDPAETERELADREKRHDKLHLRELDDRERETFRNRWTDVQREFVDDPNRAVDHADSLVNEVMSARGYPVDDFEQRAADVSVDHPVVVQRYREARRIAADNRDGSADTEALRNAVTSYRELVGALLGDDPRSDRDDDRRNGHSHRSSDRNTEAQA